MVRTIPADTAMLPSVDMVGKGACSRSHNQGNLRGVMDIVSAKGVLSSIPTVSIGKTLMSILIVSPPPDGEGFRQILRAIIGYFAIERNEICLK